MKKRLWIIGIFFIVACMKTIPAVRVAEEPMVRGCEHIGTIAQNTDTGRVLDNYRPKAHQDEILQRAANLGATHVVWLYDYQVGSAADAYRCDQ